jgi:hypothetical protein
MAVTAEQTNNQQWRLAREAFPDAEFCARQEWEVFLGGLAIKGESASTNVEAQEKETLMSVLREASEGDESSIRVVQNNVRADVFERLYKVGQRSVFLKMAQGELEQEGRKLKNVHRNTLEHTTLVPEMMRRTTQELNNVMLFEALFPTGALDDHDIVVFSPTSTSMSVEHKRKYNFFLDTESFSIQRMSVDGYEVELETAFVAGKPTPTSPRQDIDTIRQLAKNKSIEVLTSDGNEMLQHVMLVPKADMPNGVVDIVQQFDQLNGGTFYGELKPQQDYLTYAQMCEKRNQEFDETVEIISRQLIKEADSFTSPLEAILRLDELSERLCVDYAIDHREINARIFGSQSAMHIEEARFFYEQGEIERAKASTIEAKNTADSGSCPLFKDTTKQDSDNNSSHDKDKSSSKKYMKCPHCTARVYADPCAKILSCWDCSAKVVNGNVVSTGDGGSSARAKRLRDKQLVSLGI